MYCCQHDSQIMEVFDNQPESGRAAGGELNIPLQDKEGKAYQTGESYFPNRGYPDPVSGPGQRSFKRRHGLGGSITGWLATVDRGDGGWMRCEVEVSVGGERV